MFDSEHNVRVQTSTEPEPPLRFGFILVVEQELGSGLVRTMF